VQYAFSEAGGSYGVILELNFNPTLLISKADDDTVKRRTTAQLVISAFNDFNFRVDISVRGRTFSIPSKVHQLLVVGGELTGLSGMVIVASRSL